MSRDKADQYIFLQKPFSPCTCHRVAHTCSMQYRIHTPCSLMAAKRTAWRRYKNDKVKAVPNIYEGTKKKNRAVTETSVLCVSLGLFFDLFFHLRISVLLIGPAWLVILIRNIKRWNFYEQNLEYTYQLTIVTTSLNFRNGKPLEESKYQTTFHFIAMITSTQWLPVLKAPTT